MTGPRRTIQRRLRTAHPFWAETPHISVAHRAEPSQPRWDVVIVGTGISAALLAERLTRRKRRVLLVDRRQPVRGSSLASTAMIQHEIDVPLSRLARQIGPDKAARAWLRSVKAVEELLRLSRRLRLDCQMQRKRALYLAGDEMGFRALEAEAALRRETGIEAEFLSRRRLLEEYGIDRTGAIRSTASASANPAQLTAGLLRLAQERGAEIVSPFEVADFAELADGVALASSAGRVVVAGHAVFCTGYEFLPQLASAHHRIISTWAVASAEGVRHPAWLDDYLVWEAADPYLYFRTTPSGRIIAGGEDEASPDAYEDAGKLRRNAAEIARKLRETCGIRIGRPAYRWAAAFGDSDDGLPIVDAVPGCRRCHAVMGFGGNGITYSVIAAELTARRIDGRADPDADLYRFR
ncbi:NAD(P)/FAD-dependent oxidoreductase [Paracoccus versutus]|uniref:NAD(P)/FAD-dependent oxidoreductase n=1 Tax=Paracoccus versutus TaxID=34007 RepID=UPI000DF7A144|nr:FAD-dependent oxidoreductase [Paracoccus versutus]RDD73403.1 FAD-binding oxidoreductase [Paracoccus versutus]